MGVVRAGQRVAGSLELNDDRRAQKGLQRLAFRVSKVRNRFVITVSLDFRDGTTLRLEEPLSAQRMTEDSAEVFKSRLEACG